MCEGNIALSKSVIFNFPTFVEKFIGLWSARPKLWPYILVCRVGYEKFSTENKYCIPSRSSVVETPLYLTRAVPITFVCPYQLFAVTPL